MDLYKILTTPIGELFKKTTKSVYYSISLSDGTVIGVVKRRAKDADTFKAILKLITVWEAPFGGRKFTLFDKPSKLPTEGYTSLSDYKGQTCCKYIGQHNNWNTIYINPTYLY